MSTTIPQPLAAFTDPETGNNATIHHPYFFTFNFRTSDQPILVNATTGRMAKCFVESSKCERFTNLGFPDNDIFRIISSWSKLIVHPQVRTIFESGFSFVILLAANPVQTPQVLRGLPLPLRDLFLTEGRCTTGWTKSPSRETLDKMLTNRGLDF